MRGLLRIEAGVSAPVFLDAVEAVLRRREAMHTPLLAAARAWAARPDREHVLAWLAWRADLCVGAALLGPAGGLDYAARRADAEAWAQVLAAASADIRWLAGERGATAALVRRLHRRGMRWERKMTTEVMAAVDDGPLPPVAAVPGEYGVASDVERARLSVWLGDFAAETGLAPIVSPDGAVSTLIARGDLRVWRVDGEPASMIAIVARTGRTTRCSLVYTPPVFRRRGYARACTAATTRALLAEGYGICCVHVRVGDLPARALYASLGYQGLGIRVDVQRRS
jgi:hypothetical protein